MKLAKDMQNNTQMKAALEQYDFVEINAESMTKEDATALKYYVFSKNEYPFFVVVDNNGNIIKVHHGYDSPHEFIEALNPSTFGNRPYMTNEDFGQGSMRRKTRNDDWGKWRIFMYKLYYVYPWKFWAIELAPTISNLSGESKYKAGYQVGIPIYRRLSLNSDFVQEYFSIQLGQKMRS